MKIKIYSKEECMEIRKDESIKYMMFSIISFGMLMISFMYIYFLPLAIVFTTFSITSFVNMRYWDTKYTLIDLHTQKKTKK